MAPAKTLLIGISEPGVMHVEPGEFGLDERFALAKAAGVFDYFDATPASPFAVADYRAASQRHGLPVLAGNAVYFIGRDEPLLEWHLRVAADLGARVHNVQFHVQHAAGRPVTDAEVATACLHALAAGDALGITVAFEVHINRWSEHFGRIERVARQVEAAGAEFPLTLDASHVLFKLGDPEELAVQGMDADIAAGRLELDPFKPGNVCQRWIEAGYVRHAHARSVAPAGPRNAWALNPATGQPGRALQYPFVEPAPGEWHSPWRAQALEPWKHVMRQLLRHHLGASPHEVLTISTEFIPTFDYGGGAKYSIFAQNVACAAWLRAEWAALQA